MEKSPEVDKAVVEFLLRMGDNTLVLGHRISEWCGHSPVLEEDIALANQALDLIGQTQLWLGLAGALENKGRSADQLAFLRDAWDFRNVLLVEKDNGDFGNTMMRQFLFDAWHIEMLKALLKSSNSQIAEIAAKAVKEVAYHLEKSADIVIRLGDGTELSHQRMQHALDNLWSYTGELFVDDDYDETVNSVGIAPLPSSLKHKWDQTINSVLRDATLALPQTSYVHKGGKKGRHTEFLGHMLAEMQFLQRAYPGSTW
ncbi:MULTISPECIES: 1,2-phenylacetyl-CoA epoxidase subunit PaaC [Bartonella]|uniref:1,2-phenylacetyl-CoA epoxidase subunit PaaC n=1 Tax=Bartonella TaxID=773 RepID=UPI0018DCD817|nr:MULTISPECIES: 1,2-phenylacetyl-CoA epoxidase subunit PaaC [Bartonella]MBH9975766.1 phenylacetate-CoA oxygenase subunit PaaC [Bartonella choladocola]MBI0015373.1 phenylacetate-CoA oxygenase subunit PaaC [Bartonella sp. B10834G3]